MLAMALKDLLDSIDSEIARLQQARALLAGGSTPGSTHSGSRVMRKKRTLSPEARKRIADAQRRRWAAQKSGKKAA
jgi:hypothetical protein